MAYFQFQTKKKLWHCSRLGILRSNYYCGVSYHWMNYDKHRSIFTLLQGFSEFHSQFLITTCEHLYEKCSILIFIFDQLILVIYLNHFLTRMMKIRILMVFSDWNLCFFKMEDPLSRPGNKTKLNLNQLPILVLTYWLWVMLEIFSRMLTT